MPMTKKSTPLMRTAGAAVRMTARVCSGTDTPPTLATVRTTVSEIFATLSPRMSPDSAAPAAIAGSTPMTDASPTNATPTAAMVVRALPRSTPSTDAMMNTST